MSNKEKEGMVKLDQSKQNKNTTKMINKVKVTNKSQNPNPNQDINKSRPITSKDKIKKVTINDIRNFLHSLYTYLLIIVLFS